MKTVTLTLTAADPFIATEVWLMRTAGSCGCAAATQGHRLVEASLWRNLQPEAADCPGADALGTRAVWRNNKVLTGTREIDGLRLWERTGRQRALPKRRGHRRQARR